MKTNFSVFLIAVLLYSCTQREEDAFLKNFTDKKHYEYLTAKQLTNQINEADLYILNKSEAKNEFIFNSEKKYFYGYKIKLNEDTYLISYGVKYTPYIYRNI